MSNKCIQQKGVHKLQLKPTFPVDDTWYQLEPPDRPYWNTAIHSSWYGYAFHFINGEWSDNPILKYPELGAYAPFGDEFGDGEIAIYERDKYLSKFKQKEAVSRKGYTPNDYRRLPELSAEIWTPDALAIFEEKTRHDMRRCICVKRSFEYLLDHLAEYPAHNHWMQHTGQTTRDLILMWEQESKRLMRPRTLSKSEAREIVKSKFKRSKAVYIGAALAW